MAGAIAYRDNAFTSLPGNIWAGKVMVTFPSSGSPSSACPAPNSLITPAIITLPPGAFFGAFPVTATVSLPFTPPDPNARLDNGDILSFSKPAPTSTQPWGVIRGPNGWTFGAVPPGPPPPGYQVSPYSQQSWSFQGKLDQFGNASGTVQVPAAGSCPAFNGTFQAVPETKMVPVTDYTAVGLSTQVGKTSTQTVRLLNSGGGAGSIRNISISGNGFKVGPQQPADACTAGEEIAPGNGCELNVEHDGTCCPAGSTQSGTLDLETDGGATVVDLLGAITAPAPTCHGATTLIDGFDPNGGAVAGGNGKPYQFDVPAGQWCLVSIATYHWNDGKGTDPTALSPKGMLGLLQGSTTVPGTLLPAMGTAGTPSPSNPTGANVNWVTVYPLPPANPVILQAGHYTVYDSYPLTWSQNGATGGVGFARVWIEPYSADTG